MLMRKLWFKGFRDLKAHVQRKTGRLKQLSFHFLLRNQGSRAQVVALSKYNYPVSLCRKIIVNDADTVTVVIEPTVETGLERLRRTLSSFRDGFRKRSDGTVGALECDWISSSVQLAPDVSQRLRWLCDVVLSRIPSDAFGATTEIAILEELDYGSGLPQGAVYADLSVRTFGLNPRESVGETTPSTVAFVTFYKKYCDALSDDALVWVIAHQLASAANGLQESNILTGGLPGSVERSSGLPCEIALDWGFARERESWLRETSPGHD